MGFGHEEVIDDCGERAARGMTEQKIGCLGLEGASGHSAQNWPFLEVCGKNKEDHARWGGGGSYFDLLYFE